MDALIKLWSVVSKTTFKQLIVLIIAALCAILLYTAYENRQDAYNKLSISRITSDFPITGPSFAAEKMVNVFMKKHKDIALMAIIDANPVENKRVPVYRAYNNLYVKSVIEDALKVDPSTGIGPLFTASQENNRQILAIMSGEMLCVPSKEGIVGKVFPVIVSSLVYSCRVPLPPAFNKATGWISLHFDKWPIENFEQLKYDALSLSANFYELEIK